MRKPEVESTFVGGMVEALRTAREDGRCPLLSVEVVCCFYSTE